MFQKNRYSETTTYLTENAKFRIQLHSCSVADQLLFMFGSRKGMDQDHECIFFIGTKNRSRSDFSSQCF